MKADVEVKVLDPLRLVGVLVKVNEDIAFLD